MNIAEDSISVRGIRQGQCSAPPPASTEEKSSGARTKKERKLRVDTAPPFEGRGARDGGADVAEERRAWPRTARGVARDREMRGRETGVRGASDGESADPSAQRKQVFTFWTYFTAEISMFNKAPRKKSETRRALSHFFRVPYFLEQLMAYGTAVALDALLHVFTLLPVRVGVAIFLAVRWFFFSVFSFFSFSNPRGSERHADEGSGNLSESETEEDNNNNNSSSSRRRRRVSVFQRTHAYDVLRFAAFLLACAALENVQMSRIYHYIRGQAFMKLYVMFNILEIFDKLCAALGQDVLDSLYWTVRYEPWRYTAVAGHFAAVCGVELVHSFVTFARLVSLSVAFDSSSTAMLTVLTSNNFVELKSSVFKRFRVENLFQISCSDIVERMQYVSRICTNCQRRQQQSVPKLTTCEHAATNQARHVSRPHRPAATLVGHAVGRVRRAGGFGRRV